MDCPLSLISATTFFNVPRTAAILVPATSAPSEREYALTRSVSARRLLFILWASPRRWRSWTLVSLRAGLFVGAADSIG